MTKQKRVVVYIEREDYNRLKARLVLRETTASAWFREQVKRYLAEPNDGESQTEKG